MSTIKWGQRCIARRFETVEGVVSWHENLGNFVGKECIFYTNFKDGSCGVSFEADGVGGGFCWLSSALEPIPETQSVWWPRVGSKVMHDGGLKTVTDSSLFTHQLDHDTWVNVTNLSPVATTEITPEEAIALLEQHTGKSFTIKSK
jgi:hypothetical protein